MPHVAFVPFTGFRVREDELRALGMSLPGLKQRAEALAQLPALGLLTLAGMTPPPWTCSYHEARAADEALLESVLQERPQLVAVSALTASAEEAYRFCAALRGHGVPTVLGGLHATTCPDEVRRHADAVVGEGEPVWLDVLADAEAANFRPVYRPREPFDLARAPVPRFDLLGLRPRPRWTVQTQRGCPLACEFCAASRLLGPYRDKPVPKLRRELKVIANRVPRPVLELADDNSFIASAHAPAVLDLLAESGARYFTEADWRLGERPDLLPRLAASGCVQVLVGIESLTYRPQGMGPKQAEPARILDAVEAIQSAGVAVLGCFFVGCDGETRQTMDRPARRRAAHAPDAVPRHRPLQAAPAAGPAAARPGLVAFHALRRDLPARPDERGGAGRSFPAAHDSGILPRSRLTPGGDPAKSLAEEHQAAAMRIGTLARFLIGDRQAILDTAADRSALWLGALFVLSAGFAREYDGEDLLHEPWYLLIPFGASVVTSFALFGFCYLPFFSGTAHRPPFLCAYRAFLTLFWMTAPLAWLYAIPYERFLDPYDATLANLFTLGLVAAWRVALMIRVISVLLDYSGGQAFALVMAVANLIALTATATVPTPVVSFMGGVRLSRTEALIRNITQMIGCVGVLAVPVLMIAAGIVVARSRPSWQVPLSASKRPAPRWGGVLIMALASLAVWVPILPVTQPEQLLRRRVEKNMKNGHIREALAEMSMHSPTDFPPHWEPPPRLGYGETKPPLIEVLNLIADEPSAPWVRLVYLDKLSSYLRNINFWGGERSMPAGPIIRVLGRLPKGPSLAAENRETLDHLLDSRGLDAEEKETLKRLLPAGADESPRRR